MSAGITPYFSRDEAFALAKKYKTVDELKARDPRLHKWLYGRGYLGRATGHMERKHKRRWTPEAIAVEAAKYPSRSAFARGKLGAYRAAIALGLLSALLPFRPPIARRRVARKKWTPENILTEARRHPDLRTFRKAARSAYTTGLILGMRTEIRSLYPDLRLTREQIAEAAARYSSRSEFARRDPRHYNAARRLGILADVCSHMVRPPGGGRRRVWTRETIGPVAALYSSRAEFSRRAGGAYQAALDLGVIDDVCAHMARPKRRKGQQACTS